MRDFLHFPTLGYDPHLKLPLTGRQLLVNAARIEPSQPAGESVQRTKEIDATVQLLRTIYPSAFWPLNEYGFAIRD